MRNALSEFLEEIAETKYGSPENLSNQAGLTGNTVRNIIKSGSAKPITLVQLAPKVGKTPAQLFVMAGWLEPEPGELTAIQQEFLDLLEDMPEPLQPEYVQWCRRIGETLRFYVGRALAAGSTLEGLVEAALQQEPMTTEDMIAQARKLPDI